MILLRQLIYCNLINIKNTQDRVFRFVVIQDFMQLQKKFDVEKKQKINQSLIILIIYLKMIQKRMRSERLKKVRIGTLIFEITNTHY